MRTCFGPQVTCGRVLGQTRAWANSAGLVASNGELELLPNVMELCCWWYSTLLWLRETSAGMVPSLPVLVGRDGLLCVPMEPSILLGSGTTPAQRTGRVVFFMRLLWKAVVFINVNYTCFSFPCSKPKAFSRLPGHGPLASTGEGWGQRVPAPAPRLCGHLPRPQ